MQRREVLKAGVGLGVFGALVGSGFLQPRTAHAARQMENAFQAKKLDEALQALGAANATESGDVVLTAPDIAENGAVVPMEIESKLPNTEAIALFIEKNPNPLAAVFHLTPDALPRVKTRVKMGQSSDVVAVVKAGGKYYMTKKEVKVTLGGCGG
ncbi:MAG: thiosulfate oxidation carrier protein SoxY [Hydrogenophilus thermoluteolus]|uniref:thiosulfate oxidation carrier protein SoxY n=1 Tax=Hydrogenophilus thermoluteolus TaxID=297 RepID=UPI000EC6A122|nr:thiosulfate oxidation carrier protein SoxY [Hydrogenophilus thermoluteolus]MBW7656755.1 thiosulfate oxidation carrier protein SoxY [Hydrogenophilus thermoluteolus]HCO78209.1 thiosulfate oxidation carrier protein SoxY [Rhodocyclaceae bacterium]